MDFNKDVIDQSKTKPVVVDFSAAWCGPCKVLKPILERATKSRSDIDFIVIDIDNHPDIAKRFGIRSVPSVVMFKNGQPISRYGGQVSPALFNQWVDLLISN